MRNADCGMKVECGARNAELRSNAEDPMQNSALLRIPQSEFEIDSAFRIPHCAGPALSAACRYSMKYCSPSTIDATMEASVARMQTSAAMRWSIFSSAAGFRNHAVA
jgi:hypothetical protein